MRWFFLLLWLAAHAALAETVSGEVITVVDGDTLTVREAGGRRHRVRLAGIDAPERGQPFYLRAARSLAAICYRKNASVETEEQDGGGLPAAKVKCAGVDANGEQVRRGMAWTSKAQAPIGSAVYELEAYARLRKLGLWQDPEPVAPWEWRARHGGKNAARRKQ